MLKEMAIIATLQKLSQVGLPLAIFVTHFCLAQSPIKPQSSWEKAVGQSDQILYSVRITGTAGSGHFPSNHVLNLDATPTEKNLLFDRWLGDVESCSDVFNPQQKIIILAKPINLRAVYLSSKIAKTH